MGVLGKNDLLVVMLKDTGEKASSNMLKGLDVITSLEIKDRGLTSYVYVVKSTSRSPKNM